MLFFGPKALATPIDLNGLIQQIAASRYQITVFPADPEQPVELETDAPAEELEIMEGLSVAAGNGKIRIQAYPGQPARVSASVENLAGIRHLSNTSYIRLKQIAAGPTTGTHSQGAVFRKKLESVLESVLKSKGLADREHRLSGKSYSSPILPVGMDPSPALPVFMVNGTGITPSPTSTEVPSSTQVPEPSSLPEAQPAVQQGGNLCPQGLIDIAGLCGMFCEMSGSGCRSQACSYSWMAAGMGAGILLGIVLSVVMQDTLYISVGVGCAAFLGAIGYYFGKFVDKICSPCHSGKKVDSKRNKAELCTLPRHCQPSEARRMAAIPEKDDVTGGEINKESEKKASQSNPAVVVVVIEREPDAEENEASPDPDQDPDKKPSGSGGPQGD